MDIIGFFPENHQDRQRPIRLRFQTFFAGFFTPGSAISCPSIKGSDMNRKIRRNYIWSITACYAIGAALWILLSDQLLGLLLHPSAIQRLSTAKGLLFVIVTTPPLYLALCNVPALTEKSERSQPLPLAGLLDWSRPWLYVFAIATTLLTLLVRTGIAVSFDQRPLLILFMFPIILSALLGGLGPGLAATLTSAAGIDFFTIPPTNSILVADAHDLNQLSILVASGVLVSILSGVLHGQRRQTEAARQHQAITLANIDDGVITTDASGRVTFLNPEAERLTGWSQGEALGRPLANIFRIISEESRLPLADPVQKVRTTGKKSEKANHTLLLSRDGREVPIQDSIAPIRLHDRAALLGTVLVFRDDTQRRLAERVVREERALYQDLIDSQPAALYRLRVKTVEPEPSPGPLPFEKIPYRFEMISDRFCTMLGLSRQELEDDPAMVHRLIHPDDAAGFARANEKALTGFAPFVWEGRVRVGNGEQVRWLHFESLPRREENGDSLWTGILTDISARKQYETAMRASETTYRSLFENMLNSVAHARIIYADGVPVDMEYLAVNPAFYEVTGIGEQVVGRRISEVIPDYCRDNPESLEIFAKVAATGEPTRWEHYLTTLDRWFSFAIYSPAPGEVIIVTENISQRKKAELRLQESEEQLRAISDNLPDGYIYQTTQGPDGKSKFLFVSAGVSRIHGVTPEEVLHDAEVLYRQVDPAQAGELVRAEKNSIATRTDFTIELHLRRPDGKWFWLQVHSRPRWKADGSLVWDGIAIDITSKKVLEKQFTQAQKMESVGRLAGGVAHDFNNMLTVIKGHAELAMEELRPGDRPYLDLLEIQAAASRSANLTRQLLAFARKQTVRPVVLNLNDTVDSVLKMLRRLIGEDIELVWLPGLDLRQIKIDPGQIDQLLANLAINGRDAIDGVGKLTIETSNVELDEEYGAEHLDFVPGPYVQLAVSDNGCGISPAILPHVFEPFFTTKEKGRGTGLGLSTVYGIVKQNQGFINIYSEPGQGTTFHIYLPVAKEEAVEAAAQSSREALPLGTETILLVEDDQPILDLSKKHMERLGYTVLTADSPSAALRLLEEARNSIDLLVTDVVMPEMNGKELARRLQYLKPDLKCLFMSGYTANAIARQGVLDDGIFFLPKPFSARDIAIKVRETLDQRL